MSHHLPFIRPEHQEAATAYCARVFAALAPSPYPDLTDWLEFRNILDQFSAGLFAADAAHEALGALFGIDNVELTEGFERFYNISADQVAARTRTSDFKAACAAAMVPHSLALSGFKGVGAAPQQVDFGAGGGTDLDAGEVAPAAATSSPLEQGAGVLVTTPPLSRSLQHADDYNSGTAPPPDTAPAIFVHAICGKKFTAKYYVKRHHFGKGPNGGCWRANGEPPIPWDHGLPQ
ncbi:hypothetical protein H2199_005606 [Coniosporium tulheliwenetii]|uniref:Uncharacterized protein n=1 Tax=Coniosporium tulheliwenetii TaxID=3383036 RepID=A0ACC2YZZ1_9PEZI|nr:hypothetical protein H2199_005606 [Cladosporium sp. JES 115]